jgi:hypothetical protein
MNTSKGRVTSSMRTLKRLYRRIGMAGEVWLTIGAPAGAGKSEKTT